MKSLFVSIVAAVLLVGCGESQSSPPPAEVEPAEPVAIAPDISIWHAALKGNIEAVKQHIAAGTDVNAKNQLGRTPLHAAAYYGHKEIIELLIGKAADVNIKRRGGWTPLHDAAFGSHKEIVQLLIAKGANVNTRNSGGETPLDWAEDKSETADLLRKHGGKTSEELKAEGK